jgi:DNA-binding winged helix-turn-helix (wHTH) protein/predicted ATPase
MRVHDSSADSVQDSFPARAGASIAIPPFRLDLENECLWRDGELIKLKPKAFSLLRYLVDRPHRLVTKDELLRELWGGLHVGEAVLRTHLREIRQALDDRVKSPRFIETAHRRGYRFVGTIVPAQAAQPSPDAALALATIPYFVGRERELARLQAARGRAALGRRQFVFVSGQPGVGKTSLMRTFSSRQPSAGQPLAWGQCVNHYGAGEAYLPILEALGRLAGGPWRTRWIELLSRFAPTWLARLPSFWGTSGASVQDPLGVGGAPDRMLRELAEALEAFASDTPLLLMVEDIHWADVSTLGWLAYLARRTDPVRLFVVCTYRPLEVAAAPHPLSSLKTELERMDYFRELDLGELSQRDVHRYFAARFEGHRFPRPLSQLAYERTAGNPLFLVRVVDSWVKQRLLSRETGSWRLAGDFQTLAESMPVSVLSMLERDIERLCPSERALLEAASVAGTDFSVAAVAAALTLDIVDVEEVCVRWARRSQFMQSTGVERWPDGTLATRFEFLHSLYREAVYQRMGAVRRARLHLRIGERQELGHAPDADVIAPALAFHFERGQDPRAIRYHRVAGEQALLKNAYREACAHFDRGLELLRLFPDAPDAAKQGLDLQVNRGAALAITKGYGDPEVEAAYGRARALCQQQGCQQQGPTPRLFQALVGIGAYHFVRGEYRTVAEVGEQFLLLADQHRDEGATLLGSLLLGWATMYLGELESSLAHLERVLSLYDPDRHQSHNLFYVFDPAVAASCFASVVSWLLGDPERSRQRMEQAHGLARKHSDPHARVLALTFGAKNDQLRGDAQSSRGQVELGLRLSTKYGFMLCGEILKMLQGVCYLQEGRFQAGIDAMVEAAALAKARGTEYGGTAWRATLAEAYAVSARVPEALAMLAEAFESVERRAERWWEPELYRTLGVLLERSPHTPVPAVCARALGSELPAAEACFRHGLALARAMKARSLELRSALALARHWLALEGSPRASAARRRQARRLIAEIYEAFPADTTMADLGACEALLHELKTSRIDGNGAPGP